MADHQRQKIHPMVGEAAPPPTTPLVPPGSSRSEKGIPLQFTPSSTSACHSRSNIPYTMKRKLLLQVHMLDNKFTCSTPHYHRCKCWNPLPSLQTKASRLLS
ncbi:hypothetical protein Fmac_024409 [Flemingia macrophylla]|uniref:Uncharacterized protein n=1 Tax=Flemingia macrophylla TaxID=520843 RepID=A0ABD1LPA4_9FABA